MQTKTKYKIKHIRDMILVVLLLPSIGCGHSVPPTSSQDANSAPTSAPTDPSSSLESAPPKLEPQVPLPAPSDADLAKAAKYRQLGLDYRSQGRYEDAVAILQDSVNLDPQNLSGQVILGWTLHLAEQPEKAIETLQAALAQEASHVPALNALGIVYLVDGQLEAAVETHTQAVTLESANEIGYYNLSLAYHRLEDYEQAILNAKQATILDPGNPHPWVALALAQWDKKETDAAQQTYQQAIDLDPRYLESVFLDHLQQAGFSPEQIQTTNELRQLF